MSFMTLADARQTLWRYAPGSDGTAVPYASRTAADKLAVDTAINQTLQRFLTMGKWKGDTVRARFRVNNSQITLPSTLECVLGATPIRDTDADEDGENVPPYAIYSEMHEFLTSGPGNPSTECMYGLVDLGFSFPTFIDPTGEFYIRVVSTTNESGAPTILFKGLDASSNMVYTAGVEGCSLTISATANTAVTSSQSFTAIASWQKSAATTGVIRVYSVDTTTGDATLLVVIPPGKTTSGYHRYRVPDGDLGDTIECLCKRAYVAAVADNDIIVPNNIGALKLGMMALQYEDKNDMDRARQYMAEAVSLLNSELDQFRGDSVLPSVQFRPGFGGGAILNIN